MKAPAALSLFLLLFLSASDAKADAVILPNGEYGFSVTFATQGVFGCAAGVPCAVNASGNSVTLGSGANTTTITFTGTGGTMLVGAAPLTPTLGRFEITTTGSGFTFPVLPNPNLAILNFTFTISHDTPVASTRVLHWDFGPGGSTVLPPRVFDRHMAFPTGPNPPNYNFIVYTFTPFGFPATNGGMDLVGTVGATPEPATLVLLGTGLAGAAYGRVRRRRKS